ncbi:MAG: hypothetical protein K9K79_12240, partial [Desulfohalobiaceae bacterium]|nr:hypothetical protein [Desulfohalobiaceae bacterium]
MKRTMAQFGRFRRGTIIGALFLSLAGSLMSGCGYRAGVEEPSLPELSVQEIWARFQKVRSLPPLTDNGCRLKASLHLFSKKESQRIGVELWGNYSLPLRLNLKAGFGRTFAMWRVGEGQWLGYVPSRERAYTHPDSRVGVRRMGFTSPFDIQELLFFFSGQWPEVIPGHYESAELVQGKGYRYTFDTNKRITSLVLDRAGLPREIQGGRGTTWRMRFSEYDRIGERMVPRRVHLKNSRQEEALV